MQAHHPANNAAATGRDQRIQAGITLLADRADCDPLDVIQQTQVWLLAAGK